MRGTRVWSQQIPNVCFSFPLGCHERYEINWTLAWWNGAQVCSKVKRKKYMSMSEHSPNTMIGGNNERQMRIDNNKTWTNKNFNFNQIFLNILYPMWKNLFETRNLFSCFSLSCQNFSFKNFFPNNIRQKILIYPTDAFRYLDSPHPSFSFLPLPPPLKWSPVCLLSAYVTFHLSLFSCWDAEY